MSSTERRDLFGRTESELRTAIARADHIQSIAAFWGGTEGAAIKLAMKRANLDVDRRQLAIMTGEVREERPAFSEAARAKQNRELASLDRNSHRKSGGS